MRDPGVDHEPPFGAPAPVGWLAVEAHSNERYGRIADAGWQALGEAGLMA
jgi:hypothetical protein